MVAPNGVVLAGWALLFHRESLVGASESCPLFEHVELVCRACDDVDEDSDLDDGCCVVEADASDVDPTLRRSGAPALASPSQSNAAIASHHQHPVPINSR